MNREKERERKKSDSYFLVIAYCNFWSMRYLGDCVSGVKFERKSNHCRHQFLVAEPRSGCAKNEVITK